MIPVRIENRSQLIYLLTEAAELEHGIMCCYLFANFSLKNSAGEGVSEDQVASIRAWRGLIREVAVQEMVHLGSACNLLTSVGGAPQLRRPNLPTSPRAYGSTFRLRLAPFAMEVLDQFITIELPMSLMGPEADEGRPASSQKLSDVFSAERTYATQGSLYRGIEDGLKYLAQKHGEDQLFVGNPRSQTGDTYFGGLPGLIPVHDLASALEAINVIVEQGEGASVDSVESHYHKFKQIRDEYEAILLEQPDFTPARPVLTNPYAMLPADVSREEASIIDHPVSSEVCNLFDACYELMVQILGRLFVHAEESESELHDLSATGSRMMVEVIEPLGSAITLLPAGPGHPGWNAGPGFRLSRGATIPTHKTAARTIFRERLTELANYCRFLQAERGAPPVLASAREALTRFADVFATA